jgi:hypothetical protein
LKSADDFAVRAESTRNFTFITESNSVRASAKKKEGELGEVLENLDKKVKELKE